MSLARAEGEEWWWFWGERGDEARTITLDCFFVELLAFSPLSLELTSSLFLSRRVLGQRRLYYVYSGFDH